MSTSEFSNIKSQGGLLPIELLRRIAAGETNKVEYLTPHDYHLGGERINEAVTRAWTLARGHWERFKQKRQNLANDEIGTNITRSEWLLPLFKILDYGQLQRAKTNEIDGKIYPISHEAKEPVLVHFVGCGQNLDKRDSETKIGVPKMSPHSMVQEFLNRNEGRTWAFLSNGLKFRVLRDNVSLIRMAYLEFDLESIFEQESFAEFFVFYLLVHQSRVEITTEEYGPLEKNDKKAKTKADDEDETESDESVAVSKSCILERWYKTSINEGVRVLDELRSGVTGAIKKLGSGFLAQPKNYKLRELLRDNKLSKTDFYHEILRIVYRLLFLLVAEDRELLFSPTASETNKEIYKKYYSLSRLRELARKRSGSRHIDLWRVLRQMFGWLDQGRPELDLPGIGSVLFRAEFIPTLTQFELNNDALLTALRDLTFTKMNNVLQVIDYRNLGTEELGSVYESLLEMHPDIDASALSFELSAAAGNERKTTGSYYTPASLVNCLLDTALEPVLQKAMGAADTLAGREKTLLDLKICDPACGSGHFLIGAAHRLAKRLATLRSGEDEPSVAAVQHALRDVVGRCLYGVDINPMAVELCKISLWMDAMEPGRPLAFLDHHIQCGNSLLGATPALLKAGIPDEAFTAIEGDNKTYAAIFKKENKVYRTRAEGHHQESLLNDKLEVWEKQGNITRLMRHIAEQSDEEKKERLYYELIQSVGYEKLRLYPDTWCAAFVWKKCKPEDGGFDFPITESVFRKIEKSPHECLPWMRREINRLAGQYKFFHWYLAFPDVFEVDEQNPNGWKGGFDVVLGNPPWERVKLQEKEWFAERDPAIAKAPNAAARDRMIEELKQGEPLLSEAFRQALREAAGASQLIRLSGRYPLCGRGDVNTYTIFAELNRQLLSGMGRVGCIVPSGIATDDTTKFFFQDLMDNRTLASLYDFENRKKLFPAVDSRMKFSLLTMSSVLSPILGGAELAFFSLDTKDLEEEGKIFRLTPEEIAMLNPNTRTCPIFRSVKDAELTKAIYRRVPVLMKEGRCGEAAKVAADHPIGGTPTDRGCAKPNEVKAEHVFCRGTSRLKPTRRSSNGDYLESRTCSLAGHQSAIADATVQENGRLPCNPWGITFSRMFDMSNDSHLFRTREDLEQQGFTLEGNHFVKNKERFMPLYEAKMIHQFNHRFGDYADLPKGSKSTQLPNIPEEKLRNPDYAPLPRYWVPEKDVHKKIPKGTKYLMGLRDITNATNERTVIASMLSVCAVGHTMPLFYSSCSTTEIVDLLSCCTAFMCDYVARQKIGGTHLTYGYINQLPVISPSFFSQNCPFFLSITVSEFILPRVRELTYTSSDLLAFERSCGFEGMPFRWDVSRRFLLRCELDALFFGLYLGFGEWSEALEHIETAEERLVLLDYFADPRCAIEYMMDTFPIVRRKDESRYGSFRTKETILSIYNTMVAAIRGGTEYVSCLDPPPADDSLRHV